MPMAASTKGSEQQYLLPLTSTNCCRFRLFSKLPSTRTNFHSIRVYFRLLPRIWQMVEKHSAKLSRLPWKKTTLVEASVEVTHGSFHRNGDLDFCGSRRELPLDVASTGTTAASMEVLRVSHTSVESPTCD